MSAPHITLGQQRLQELAAGHPLAVARLRSMQAVIDAALDAIRNDTGLDLEIRRYALEKALREGNWL